MIYDCIIIGGGASGLMCASALDLHKNKMTGLLLEGTSRLGTKLLITGGGHCNITHAGSIKDFLKCYGLSGSDSAKSIRRILYKHNNEELIRLLESEGVPTVTNEEGRVFPESMKAEDVLNVLLKRAHRNGWEFKTDHKVESIVSSCESNESNESNGTRTNDSLNQSNPTYIIICANGNRFECRNLIIAAGGITYPKTGSDGTMHQIIKRDLGIPVTALRPALTPIHVTDYPYSELAGVSVSGVKVVAKRSGSKDCKFTGDMLLAHDEFTGPVMLAASRDAVAGSSIEINYVASLGLRSPEEVRAELEHLMAGSNKDVANILSLELGIPRRLAHRLCERAGVSIKALAQMLAADRFMVESAADDRLRGMITCGGVPIARLAGEADPTTLEVVGRPGCYIAGELLDIDGITGGYNLQFCYSSACCIADSICNFQQM